MRKTGKILICALLALSIMASLLAVTAFAWDDINVSAQGTVGEYFGLSVDMPNGEEVDQYYLNSGSLPAGLSLGVNQSCIVILGTPTSAGTYSFVVDIRTNSTDYRANVSITIKSKSTNVYSGSVKATQGKALAETEVCNVDDMIQTCTIVSGKMPTGMELTQYDTYFTVSGTPTQSGTFTVKMNCETEGEPCTVTITITVEPGELKITKSPGGETVKEGEKASFVSAAECYSDVEWRIVSKDGGNCWRESKTYHEIESGFPGVKVTTAHGDDGREWMTLSNIPYSMNGYYIETKFWSTDKTKTAFTTSRACLLTVEKTELKAPVISVNPESAEKTIGEVVTLTVKATDPNGGALSYQWYSSTSNSTVGGTPITGATGTSLNVPQTEGTIYYYVSVASKKDTQTSAAVSSSVAAVTYNSAAAPSATPAPTAAPTATPTAAPTPVPTVTPAAENTNVKKGNSFLTILLIVLVLALIGTAVWLAVVSAKEKKETAARAASEGWRCPTCGRRNRGRFCPDCGTAKPKGELQYVCDKCGWTPDDPTHPPKFCPECGDPFGDEDIV